MDGLIDVIESKILPIVAKVAPMLASVLGSPLAGVGISLLAQCFGISPKDINAVANAVTNTPDASVKIKQLELDHADTLAQLQAKAQNYAAEIDDRKDARRNSVLFKDFVTKFAYALMGIFVVVILLSFLPLDLNASQKDLLSILLGMLVSKLENIIDFFYGSSRKEV